MDIKLRLNVDNDLPFILGGDNELDKRVKILKYVCSYVFETRRFKGDNIRSNIFRMYEMDQRYNIHKNYEFLSDRINNLNQKKILLNWLNPKMNRSE